MSAAAVRTYKPIEQMSEVELAAALEDPDWRLRNLYYIKDKDGQTVIFAPNEEQEKFLTNLWYRNVVPKARQRGFSTLTQLLMLDTCLFVPNSTTAVIAQDEKTAKAIVKGKIKFAYERLPELVRQMVPLIKDNVEELGWGNGSSMSVSTSVRGGTLDFLHVSEYGIICLHDPGKAAEIQEGSLPAVPQGGIAVIESTVESPYGNFSDMVRAAQAHAAQKLPLTPMHYRLHFASWWDAREYELDPTGIPISPQDHAYFHRIESEIGRSISLRKRAWYVTKRDSEFGGVSDKMWRQYPSTLKEAFQVATNGLWLAEQMANARKGNRITDVPLMAGVPVNTFWDIGTDDATSIWLHQQVGPRDHFVGYLEGSGEPPSFYVSELQRIQSTRKLVWGTHYLPHDGAHRRINATQLTTYQDMIGDLGLKDVEIVNVCADVDVAIQLMREDFAAYWFDQTECKVGIEHLDGFAKVFNKSMQVFTGSIAKNGHQHAADALRQKAQAKDQGLLSRVNHYATPTTGRRKPRRSAMTA
jgi:hypothetical protein